MAWFERFFDLCLKKWVRLWLSIFWIAIETVSLLSIERPVKRKNAATQFGQRVNQATHLLPADDSSISHFIHAAPSDQFELTQELSGVGCEEIWTAEEVESCQTLFSSGSATSMLTHPLALFPIAAQTPKTDRTS